MTRPAALAALVSLAACASPTRVPATEVLLIVDATSSVRIATDHMQVEISGSTERDGPYTGTVVEAYGPPSAQVGYPRRFGLIPAGDDDKRFFEAHATAFDASGTKITEAIVRSGYIAHELLELRIVLDDACRGVTCPMGQVCRHGGCQDIFVDPGMLPHGDAGAPDAAVGEMGPADGGTHDGSVPPDAPPADGGTDAGPVDAGPTCTAASCDDHNPCNGVETCIEGICAPGTAMTCDDGVACTIDSCEVVTRGCVHMANDAACTAMPGGTCNVAAGCQYPTCDATTCANDPSTCTMGTCSGATCLRVGCASGTMCCGGVCGPVGCDDGNACTDDSCTPGGCVHANNTNPCSDGIACTTGDRCGGGTCLPGASSCNDGNPCSDDACDHTMGTCTFTNNSAPCSDGNDCTSGDGCSDGACQPGSPIFCDDANDCTDDVCTPMGTCVHPFTSAGTFCTDTFSCEPGVCSSGGCVPSGMGCGGLNMCCNGSCIPDGSFCG